MEEVTILCRLGMGASSTCLSAEPGLSPDLNQCQTQLYSKRSFEAHPKRAIPRSRAEGHAVSRYTETGDTVFVAGQDADTFALECVPDIAGPVIVAAKEETT